MQFQKAVRPLRGEISVPGDKSISHRAVMFGAISEGTTEVTNFLQGADCLSTISCFRSMGIEIENTPERILVHGKGLHGLSAPSAVLDCGNSGTTMAMLCFQGDQVYPFYIGDSRIYLYNGTDLYRLTSDHTLANHKLQTGIYTKEEAELSSDRNKLIQFLGADLQHFPLPHAAQPPLRIYRGYRFLLCSDGLTDMCDDQTIYRVLSSGQPDMANELMQLAMDAGGVDNTTLILIEVL